MEIDNFDLITGLLDFESSDTFYFLQLIQRKKENKSIGSNNRVVKTYFIKNKLQLQDLKFEIMAICHVTRSRAYINLNSRSFRKTALRTMRLLCDHISNEDYSHAYNSYMSACGKYSDDKRKTFIVDLDYDNGVLPYNIEDITKVLDGCHPFGSKCLGVIPTKNGMHLIVKAFNLQEFKSWYPNIDVHKNNPTILYIPENL